MAKRSASSRRGTAVSRIESLESRAMLDGEAVWTGTAGNRLFEDPANWDINAVPENTADLGYSVTLNDMADVKLGADHNNDTLTTSSGSQSIDLNGKSYSLENSLDIGSTAGSTTAMTSSVNSALLTTPDTLIGLSEGSSELRIDGPVNLQSTTSLIIGKESAGVLTVDHGATASTGFFRVGNGADGSLSVKNGSSLEATGVTPSAIGEAESGTATVTDANSKLNVQGDLFVGGAASGTLTVTNGGAVKSTTVHIGDQFTGYGVVTVDGTNSSMTLANNGSLFVGQNATDGPSSLGGALNITNGATVTVPGSEGDTEIGGYGGSTGKGGVTVDGATLNTSILNVGASGGSQSLGVLSITNGGLVTSATSNVGTTSAGFLSGNGDVYLGGGSKWNAGSLTLGDTGQADMFVDGASTVQGNNLNVGEQGTGSLSLLGASSLNFSGLVAVGVNGELPAPINGGSPTPAGNGTLSVSGTGTTAKFGALQIGVGGTGELSISDGAKATQTSAEVDYVGVNDGSDGTISVQGNGATLTTQLSLVIGHGGQGSLIIGQGGTVSSPSGEVGTGFSVGGNVTGKGNVQVNSGTWAITDPAGNFTVGRQDGQTSATVDVEGTGQITYAGKSATQNPNTTIKGNGSVKATGGGVIKAEGVGAIIAPGAADGSLATLTFDSDFDASKGVTLQVELGAGGQAGQGDRLDVTGTATLSGNLDVSATGAQAYVSGNYFDVLKSNGQLTGFFSNLPEGRYSTAPGDTTYAHTTDLPELSPGLAWQVDYGNLDHNTQSEVRLYVVKELNTTLRDFKAGYDSNGTAIPGTLQAFEIPLTGSPPQPITGQAIPGIWYTDSTYSIRVPFSGGFTTSASGISTFGSNPFFVADGQGFGNQGKPHNQDFTLEGHGSFVYHGDEFFDVTSDDDFWMSIGGTRVVDLGGLHPPAESKVSLSQFGFTPGQVYQYDFYYAERHVDNATLTIVTNARVNGDVAAAPVTTTPSPVVAQASPVSLVTTLDLNGAGTQVNYYLDNGDGFLEPGTGGDQLLGAGIDDGSGHFSITAATTGLAPGNYAYLAQVLDAEGNQVAVVPTHVQVLGTLPTGWSYADVGTASHPGVSGFDGGVYTLAGGGSGLADPTDAFQLASESVSGDQTIIASAGTISQLVGSGTVASGAQAGLMMRATSDANSAYAGLFANAGGGLRFQWRSATGGTTASMSLGSVPSDALLKLVKSGETITALYSIDGTTWTAINAPSIDLGTGSYLAGLALTAQDDSALDEVQFTNVSLIATPQPPSAFAGSPISTSQIALSWATPAGAVDGFNIYRATTSGGQTSTPLNSTLISASATSYQDLGLVPGATYYYVIRAVHDGEISRASDEIAVTTPLNTNVTQVDLSSDFNHTGIVADGSQFANNGGLDFGGTALSANLLEPTQGIGDVYFNFGPTGANNVVYGNQQTIAVPASHFDSLQLLATGVNGNQLLQQFVIHYSDGSHTTVLTDISDWFTPRDETQMLTMPYRNNFDGTQDDRTFHLYDYTFTLDSSKFITGITLPDNIDVMVAAVDLLSSGTSTQPAAPTGLSAAATSGAITLTWDSPTDQVGAYYIYRGTSPGAESGVALNSTPISGTLSSYVDSTAVAGNTYYYTVRAANGTSLSDLSNESSATIAAAGPVTQADLSAAFNVSGIVADGTVFSSGLDGGNAALSATLLGTSEAVGGVSYIIGAAGAPNVVNAQGQTLTLPAGQFSRVDVLATSVIGNQLGQSFTVNYTDGTSQTFVRDMSDWFSPQNFSGETVAIATAHRNLSDGSQDDRTFNVYGYQLNTDSSKTISSITLPNNANVKLLAISEVTPSAAPTDLTATAVSASEIDLSWSAPAGGVTGYYVYRASTSGGQSDTPLNATPLPASATSYQDTAALGLSTYYYVVKAIDDPQISAPSNESSATTPAGTFEADLSGSFNRNGITADGVVFTGGLDGGATALSGTQVGTNLTWNGVAFAIGAVGGNNVASATGQTVALPAAHFATLNLLATSVNGDQADQTFTVNYSDGTSETFTQSLSDWFSPQGYTGESVALATAYRNLGDGTSDNRAFNVYGYSFALDSSKTVTSITLPNNSNVNILAITMTQ